MLAACRVEVAVAAALLHLAGSERLLVVAVVVRAGLVAVALALGVDGGPQVDVEAEDVGREDEGDDPLEHGARVVVLGEGAGDEGDGQQDLDDDEAELDPEGDAEDRVRAVAFERVC